jgi:hypothetical protein
MGRAHGARGERSQGLAIAPESTLAPAGDWSDTERTGRDHRRRRTEAGSDLPASREAPGRRCRRPGDIACRQVFGLASVADRIGRLVSTASRPEGGQCFWWRSFSRTAAGQPRIHTGFPLSVPRPGGRETPAPSHDSGSPSVSTAIRDPRGRPDRRPARQERVEALLRVGVERIFRHGLAREPVGGLERQLDLALEETLPGGHGHR